VIAWVARFQSFIYPAFGLLFVLWFVFRRENKGVENWWKLVMLGLGLVLVSLMVALLFGMPFSALQDELLFRTRRSSCGLPRSHGLWGVQAVGYSMVIGGFITRVRGLLERR
jgi:hypothetical protein